MEKKNLIDIINYTSEMQSRIDDLSHFLNSICYNITGHDVIIDMPRNFNDHKICHEIINNINVWVKLENHLPPKDKLFIVKYRDDKLESGFGCSMGCYDKINGSICRKEGFSWTPDDTIYEWMKLN